MKKNYEDFEGMAISLLPPQKFAIQTWFCNYQQYLCLFRIFSECIPSILIQEKCWFSQINFFIMYFQHRIKILFLSS